MLNELIFTNFILEKCAFTVTLSFGRAAWMLRGYHVLIYLEFCKGRLHYEHNTIYSQQEYNKLHCDHCDFDI